MDELFTLAEVALNDSAFDASDVGDDVAGTCLRCGEDFSTLDDGKKKF